MILTIQCHKRAPELASLRPVIQLKWSCFLQGHMHEKHVSPFQPAFQDIPSSYLWKIKLKHFNKNNTYNLRSKLPYILNYLCTFTKSIMYEKYRSVSFVNINVQLPVKWVSLPTTQTGNFGFLKYDPTSQYRSRSKRVKKPISTGWLIPTSSKWTKLSN